MVRLPDSPDEWQEHRHTSGRLYLTNTKTKETKWLWQKWDMNGRLFVRNIADPSQHIWVDSMDFNIRIASGMADPAEIEEYKRQQLAPPPPPPLPTYGHHIPYPPTSVQHNYRQRQPLRSHPYPPPFPHPSQPYPDYTPAPAPYPPHGPPQSYADAAKGFGPPYPSGPHEDSAQYNGYAPNSHLENLRHPHQLPQKPPVNPQMHSPFRPPTSIPFDRYGPAHQLPPPHPPLESFPSDYNRDAIPSELPHDIHPNTSPQFDSEQQASSFRQRNARNHSFLSPNFDPSANHADKRKRFQGYQSNGAGRYWAKQNDTKPSKRYKSEQGSNGKHKQGKSRFSSFTSDRKTPLHPPRPAPLPITPDSLIPKTRDANFRPTSKYAKLMKACADAGDTTKVAMLYNRDFRPSTTENGASSSFDHAKDGDDEYGFTVVGTCEDIEKDFLRLTSAPKPSAVRPPHILKQSLAHIKQLWRDAERDYDWVCRQLKSVRQDYKVQHVQSIDVVDVYETHARIALEKGDLGEFNTCVAQVQELYEKVHRSERVQDEFASYRILYNLLVGAKEWEQSKILSQLTGTERARKATRFALHIRQAVVSGNYYNYFKLSHNPPPKTMISYLLHHFHDRVRWRAISAMVNAYGPSNIPVRYISEQLGWTNLDEIGVSDLTETVQIKASESGFLDAFNTLSLPRESNPLLRAISFLLDMGVILTVEDNDKPKNERLVLDCKATKGSGIKKLEASKLITHAGAERS